MSQSNDDRYGTATLKRSLKVYYLAKLGSLVIGFVFQIVLVKTLSPDQFATFAVLLACLLTGERLLSFGVDRTILRFVPTLTTRADISGLRWLGLRLALLRLLSLLLFVLLLLLGSEWLEPTVGARLHCTTLVAFAVWFAATALYGDADALAQSLTAHLDTAVIASLEVLIRIAAIVWLGLSGHQIDTHTVVVIYASTASFAMLALGYRLGQGAAAIRARPPNDKVQYAANPEFDLKHAPSFAAAAYGSTMGWWISSPSVVRIVARTGLDTVGFAAFCFNQVLSGSLQRAFPGLLVLPTLEPVMAQAAGQQGDARHQQMLATFAAIFKTDLICVLSGIIVVAIIGYDLTALLSRPIYAPFYYILAVLMVTQVVQTAYRICELVMSVALRHRVFLGLWPLSLVSLLVMYWTVGAWGLWSVLAIPLVESAIRVGFLVIVFRQYRILLALDLPRSAMLVLSAGVVLVGAFVLKSALSVGIPAADVGLVAIALTAFGCAMLLVPPFRRAEYDILTSMFPSAWSFVRRLVLLVSER